MEQWENPIIKNWSKLLRLGAADFEIGHVEQAIRHYRQALLLARNLIDDTIMLFDGDMCPLNCYTNTIGSLVALYTQIGDSAAALSCLKQAAHTFLAILKNQAYPELVRGRVIREFEPLMELAIQFYQSEGRPDEAFAVVGNWLIELCRYVETMRPVAETVGMN